MQAKPPRPPHCGAFKGGGSVGKQSAPLLALCLRPRRGSGERRSLMMGLVERDVRGRLSRLVLHDTAERRFMQEIAARVKQASLLFWRFELRLRNRVRTDLDRSSESGCLVLLHTAVEEAQGLEEEENRSASGWRPREEVHCGTWDLK
ncbi:hypothetical protein EYF80_060853 [Liparis tanakae]|uniref:Uncharacterized protein n=1 Tax=Liparis tanakae TaxID=230148 RepID=A0A4Z2EJM7_9TELE|nr:hypothetical protein EYF80_060853 [Liparis tanakae]